MAAQRNRIANHDLEFLENTIAAANRITRIVPLVADEIDDLTLLELLDDISQTADRIRKRAIEEMHERKQNAPLN